MHVHFFLSCCRLELNARQLKKMVREWAAPHAKPSGAAATAKDLPGLTARYASLLKPGGTFHRCAGFFTDFLAFLFFIFIFSFFPRRYANNLWLIEFWGLSALQQKSGRTNATDAASQKITRAELQEVRSGIENEVIFLYHGKQKKTLKTKSSRAFFFFASAQGKDLPKEKNAAKSRVDDDEDLFEPDEEEKSQEKAFAARAAAANNKKREREASKKKLDHDDEDDETLAPDKKVAGKSNAGRGASRSAKDSRIDDDEDGMYIIYVCM